MFLAASFFSINTISASTIPAKDSTTRDTTATVATAAPEVIFMDEQMEENKIIFAELSGNLLSIALKPSRKNTIRITDASNNRVFTAVSNSRMQTIDLSAFIPGIYTISVNNKVVKKLQLTR